MQTTSATYAALLAADAPREVRAVIAGTPYGQDKIVSAKSAAAVLKGNQLVGNCISAQLNLSLREPGTIPRMAQIDLGVRLNDGTTQSGWLPKGTFYIDTRTQEDDVLKITAYDAMLKAEQSFTRSGDQGEWPRTDISVVNEIAQRIGVSVDARTTAMLNKGYLVQYPGIVLDNGTPKYSADGGLTMREVLGCIGVMYGGNWVISDAGALRLVGLTDSGDATALGNDVGALETSPAFDAISRVTLIVGTDEDGDEVSYTAGADTGRELTAKCPWATQTIANNLLTALGGYVYQPFTAGDALLDPAAELGDEVSVGGVTSQLGSIATTFDALYTADIAAPQDEEIDHEYPYEPAGERTIARKAATVTAELRVMGDTISSKVSSAEAQTMINQSISGISLSASAGSNQSTVTITAGGIVVDSAVVRFSNIVADEIVANASISSPVITGGTISGASLQSTATNLGTNYGVYVSAGELLFKSAGATYGKLTVGDQLGRFSIWSSSQVTIDLNSDGELWLGSRNGLILDSSMYGTALPASAPAGRVFFLRN